MFVFFENNSILEIMNGGYVPRRVSASFNPLSKFLDTKYLKVSKGKKDGLISHTI